MAAVLLVRHGERLDYIDPKWIKANATNKPWDPPLSENGSKQAEMLVSGVKSWCSKLGLELGAIYSSNMQRCVSTAAPIANATGLPIVIKTDLTEWFAQEFYTSWGCADSNGHWASGTPPLLPELLSTAMLPAQEMLGLGEDSLHFKYTWKSPESQAAMTDRGVNCVESLCAAHPGKAVLIVTHAGLVESTSQLLTGQAEVVWPPDTIPYAGMTILRRSGTNWEQVCYRDATHTLETVPN